VPTSDGGNAKRGESLTAISKRQMSMTPTHRSEVSESELGAGELAERLLNCDIVLTIGRNDLFVDKSGIHVS